MFYGRPDTLRSMYGLPENESFRFFVGRRLDSVRFGRYQVTFQFDGSVSLSVEGGLGIRVPEADEIVVDDARDAAAVLLAALDTSVVDVQVHDSRSFSMLFEHGLSLRLIDDQEQFESFNMSHDGKLIVV